MIYPSEFPKNVCVSCSWTTPLMCFWESQSRQSSVHVQKVNGMDSDQRAFCTSTGLPLLPPLHSWWWCSTAPPWVVWGILWHLIANFRNQYSCFVLSLSVCPFVCPSVHLSVCLSSFGLKYFYLVWAGFVLSCLSLFPNFVSFWNAHYCIKWVIFAISNVQCCGNIT